MDEVNLIVSRHEGAIQWLQEEASRYGLDVSQASIIANASPDDVAGKTVIGNLPMSLAALCDRFFAIEFDGPPPRGSEYGIQEMRSSGARLTEYKVFRVT